MNLRKRLVSFGAVVLFVFATAAMAVAAPGGRAVDTPGIPLYVIIEVTWDGVSEAGDWTVWGPKWDPVVGGTPLTSCTDCLEVSYSFTFRGKTVHFDEIYVDTVVATPQVHHVVLHDRGDGTYVGSLSSAHYFPWRAEDDGTWPVLYFDRIDYEVTFDGDGNVATFHYLQYEHKKLP